MESQWPFPTSAHSREQAKQVPCPICKGEGRVPYEGDMTDELLKICSWYDPATRTVECTNCRTTTPGRTWLRSDGTPCDHEFVYTLLGNCYHGYSCKHCPASYTVDSGD